MAKPTRSYFETLTNLVQNALDKITLNRLDFNPERVLWEVHGSQGQYHIRFKEVHTKAERLYSYYVIRNNEVIVGFDNYPDRHVLRQKYGKDFSKHLFEQVPHKHGFCKTTIELTEEINVVMFLKYLKENIMGR
jgi:hypothetical protein